MIDIITGDITTVEADAVVNAANSGLRGGGGVDGAIHRASGPRLLAELREFPGCDTGDAVRTGAYDLRAKYVIHAVGPVWQGGGNSEPELLARAYESAFARASEAGDVRSIAFPAISTGVYSYPKPEAARIALGTMVDHEPEYDRIVACLFDEADATLYRRTLAELRGER
jgi:O-acetyl-ADP-ribose deacetylase